MSNHQKKPSALTSSSDILNHYNTLRSFLLQIHYSQFFDAEELLRTGNNNIILPIIKYVLTGLSHTLTRYFLSKSYTCSPSSAPAALISTLFKLLRVEFHYFPRISAEQFTSNGGIGYTKHKIILLNELIRFSMQKHNELVKSQGKTGKVPAKNLSFHFLNPTNTSTAGKSNKKQPESVKTSVVKTPKRASSAKTKQSARSLTHNDNFLDFHSQGHWNSENSIAERSFGGVTPFSSPPKSPYKSPVHERSQANLYGINYYARPLPVVGILPSNHSTIAENNTTNTHSSDKNDNYEEHHTDFSENPQDFKYNHNLPSNVSTNNHTVENLHSKLTQLSPEPAKSRAADSAYAYELRKTPVRTPLRSPVATEKTVLRSSSAMKGPRSSNSAVIGTILEKVERLDANLGSECDRINLKLSLLEGKIDFVERKMEYLEENKRISLLREKREGSAEKSGKKKGKGGRNSEHDEQELADFSAASAAFDLNRANNPRNHKIYNSNNNTISTVELNHSFSSNYSALGQQTSQNLAGFVGNHVLPVRAPTLQPQNFSSHLTAQIAQKYAQLGPNLGEIRAQNIIETGPISAHLGGIQPASNYGDTETERFISSMRAKIRETQHTIVEANKVKENLVNTSFQLNAGLLNSAANSANNSLVLVR
jgi:hypothetical protein